MEQRSMPIDWFVGYELNPRTMPAAEMEKLVRSIEEFGFVSPVIARAEDGLVLGGHQRLAAMRKLAERKKLPLEEVTVPAMLVPGITDDRAKLLNVALNKISGSWDYDRLTELFSSIELSDPSDLELSGFSLKEIGDMGALLAEVPELTGAVATTEDADAELDRTLVAMHRRFVFELDEDEAVAVVRKALEAFGSLGDRKTAAQAFVHMAKASMVQK